jgi:hypothetical protein
MKRNRDTAKQSTAFKSPQAQETLSFPKKNALPPKKEE